MKETINGWVIINIGHPSTGDKYIIPDSFRYYKYKAIADFTKDSGAPWKYWYRKYNFRCVKATSTITLKESTEL